MCEFAQQVKTGARPYAVDTAGHTVGPPLTHPYWSMHTEGLPEHTLSHQTLAQIVNKALLINMRNATLD